MSEKWYERTQLLLGAHSMGKLSAARVAVFGVGGVGGYVVEALARSGVGAFLLVDSDRISVSNLNRQIIATRDTIGEYKVDAAKNRILSINPDCAVETRCCFFLPENAAEFDFSAYDYVVDAVDTVTAKIGIIMHAKAAGTPVISAMGAGNKLNPAGFEVADIYATSIDPLARVMRRELKKRGVRDLKVVYSKEKPLVPGAADSEQSSDKETTDGQTTERPRKVLPGSTAFVPAAAGLVIAGEVVRDLCSL